MGVRYDRDDDPDRDINTLVWHKRPVERLASGSKGEPAQYGYQRRDTGKIYYTTSRGHISDDIGSSPPTVNAPPMWLRPRLGAPDRVGKISRAKSKFFDDSIPHCNCTSTHIQDLKIDQGSKLDYRRNCPIHKLIEPGADDGADNDDLVEDEHGCICESMYRADIRKKRDGRFEPQRRCRIHGPYHAPITEEDEKDGSTWRQLLRSATRKFKGEDDDSSDEDEFDDEKIDRVRPRSWAPPRTQTSSTFFDEKIGPSSMINPTFGKIGRSQSTRHSVNPVQTGMMMTPPVDNTMRRSPTFGTIMNPPMRVDTKGSTSSTDSGRSVRSNGSAKSNSSGKSKYTISIAGDEGDGATTNTANMSTTKTKAIPIPQPSPKHTPTPSGVARSHSTRVMTLKPLPRTPTENGVPIPIKSPMGRLRSGSDGYAMGAQQRVQSVQRMQTMPFPGVDEVYAPVPQGPPPTVRGRKISTNRLEHYQEQPMI